MSVNLSALLNPISLGNLDSQLGTAQNLLQSSSLSDQLQGQQMMNQVMRQFQSISTFLKNLNDMEKQAIDNSRSNG